MFQIDTVAVRRERAVSRRTRPAPARRRPAIGVADIGREGTMACQRTEAIIATGGESGCLSVAALAFAGKAS